MPDPHAPISSRKAPFFIPISRFLEAVISVALVFGSHGTARADLPSLKPLVVVVPDITSSKLYDRDGEQRWPPRIFRFIKDFEALSCDETGVPRQEMEVGWPQHDIYEGLVKHLTKAGYEVHRFGYDWRLGQEHAGSELARFLGALRPGPVSLVSHGMGGLVASRYLKQHGGSRVHRLVSIGTPYLGTPGTLNVLESGEVLPNFLSTFLAGYFQDLFRRNPSWFQLLPSPSYFELLGTSVVTKRLAGKAAEAPQLIDSYAAFEGFLRTRPWINLAMLDQARNVLSATQLVAILGSVDSYFIVGDGQPTIGSLSYAFENRDGREEVVSIRPQWTNGDGTVVLGSATMGGRIESIHPGHSYYVAEPHDGLLTHHMTMAQLTKILGGSGAPIAGMRQQPQTSLRTPQSVN